MKFILIVVLSMASKHEITAVRVGMILNTSLTMIPSSNITMNKTSCHECLCTMLMNIGNSSGVSFNCYVKDINWVVCQLFTMANYWFSSFYNLEDNSNSTFYFMKLPSKDQSMITTIHTDVASSAAISTANRITIPVTLPPTHIFWPFDSNCDDFYNVYNGVAMNNVSFVSPGYAGYGSALSLNASKSHYVLVSNFLNMTYTSFTWELWAYPLSLVNADNVMVGMCESAVPQRCLHLMIRSTSALFAFYNDDCQSSTVVGINQWHHFAFVYDYTNRTQYIYLNGNPVCKHNISGPFLGNSGVITIGAINKSGGTAPSSYWTGYIDQLSYVSRVKTEIEILTDATLVAYYSFDNGSFYDLGPNKINGTGINVSSIAGRVNEGILFNASTAYFQANGFTLLGASYRSYSIALWIYKLPPATGGGAIIHLTRTVKKSSPWCMPILGLSSSGEIVAQSYASSVISTAGPILPLQTWTHVVTSYSNSSGVRLWVNGSLVNASGPFNYAPSRVPNTIILASLLNETSVCKGGLVDERQFYGMMDEVRVYSRELNASDIYALAYP